MAKTYKGFAGKVVDPNRKRFNTTVRENLTLCIGHLTEARQALYAKVDDRLTPKEKNQSWRKVQDMGWMLRHIAGVAMRQGYDQDKVMFLKLRDSLFKMLRNEYHKSGDFPKLAARALYQAQKILGNVSTRYR